MLLYSFEIKQCVLTLVHHFPPIVPNFIFWISSYYYCSKAHCGFIPGEGCSGCHAASHVVGESGASGKTDGAECLCACRLLSEVSLHTLGTDHNGIWKPEYIKKKKNIVSKQKDNKGPSFETISASGPNAALAHYR